MKANSQKQRCLALRSDSEINQRGEECYQVYRAKSVMA